MRGADIIGRLFHGHRPVVDIAGPHIADALLAFQIVLRHMLHGDRRVLKVFDLSLVSIFADKSGIEYNKDQYPYGMTEKESCSDEQNGKVLGIAINDDSKQKATVTSFANIEQNAVYTAHKSGKVYRLILPPCSLSEAPVVWLRDGNRRFKMPLSIKEFTEGTLYKVTMKL